MNSLALSLALAAVQTPGAYPVEPVWDSFASFCAAKDGALAGWTEFTPEPGTSLAYLAEDPIQRLTGMEGKSATVYLTTVKGRTLFAFKRLFSTEKDPVEFCQVYDFQASDRLNVSDWSKVAGTLSDADEREYTQSFHFGAVDNPRRLSGTIILHQRGYFPIPDTVGFTGLQLVAISKESL